MLCHSLKYLIGKYAFALSIRHRKMSLKLKRLDDLEVSTTLRKLEQEFVEPANAINSIFTRTLCVRECGK